MLYPSDVWRQLKNISVEELIKALKYAEKPEEPDAHAQSERKPES